MDAKLQEIYMAIPKASCPENCGRCCGPVFPSLREERNVKAWCAAHRIEYRPFLLITEDGSCPYLESNKRCLIYPVRPFLCRILGASTELSCPIDQCKAGRLLNKPQSDALYKAIYLHGKEKRRTEKHRLLVREVLRQSALSGSK